MTEENIIRMAQEAGFEGCAELTWEDVICTEELIAFAKLVAEHERKACEKIIWNADAWIGSDAKIWIVKSIQEARGQA
jgi:uncharacterized protein involved in copper resistance